MEIKEKRLREDLSKNKNLLADDYKDFLIENCTTDADLDTDFKDEDIENLKQFVEEYDLKNYIKKTKEQRAKRKQEIKEEREKKEKEALKEMSYLIGIYNKKDWLKVAGVRTKGYFRKITITYADQEEKNFLLIKIQYEVLLKELELKEISLIENNVRRLVN